MTVSEIMKDATTKNKRREERRLAFEKKCEENPHLLREMKERLDKSLARRQAMQEQYKKQREERKKFNERVRQDGIKMIKAHVRSNEGRIAYKVNEPESQNPTVDVAYAFCSPTDKFSRRTATEIVYMRISGQDNGRHSFSFPATSEIVKDPIVLESCVLGFMKSRAEQGIGMPQRFRNDPVSINYGIK